MKCLMDAHEYPLKWKSVNVHQNGYSWIPIKMGVCEYPSQRNIHFSWNIVRTNDGAVSSGCLRISAAVSRCLCGAFCARERRVACARRGPVGPVRYTYYVLHQCVVYIMYLYHVHTHLMFCSVGYVILCIRAASQVLDADQPGAFYIILLVH